MLLPGQQFIGFMDQLAARSVSEVLKAWLGMVLSFGILYWLVNHLRPGSLLSGGQEISESWDSFLTSIYFSAVTATSVGYGDVVPVGIVRLFAMIEAALGLLIFGFVISKFLSRRQEEVMDEIHRIAFEDRLGRVQTNLHLVLSELQTVIGTCKAQQTSGNDPMVRAESVVLVFTSELRSIHDLLYRPQQPPDEAILEGILTGLLASLNLVVELSQCLQRPFKPSLQQHFTSVGALATDICGECVPREYAPRLKDLMNAIQAAALRLPSTGN